MPKSVKYTNSCSYYVTKMPSGQDSVLSTILYQTTIVHGLVNFEKWHSKTVPSLFKKKKNAGDRTSLGPLSQFYHSLN